MAIINPPAWIQAGSYSARADRNVISGLISRSGVVDPSSFTVSQTATPSMKLNVSDGPAFILGTSLLHQGCYHVLNDATAEVTLADSHPTSPRIDLIVLRVYDAESAGSQNEARIEPVTGSAAASPVARPLPASSIELARVTVPAGATAITNANINTTNKALATFHRSLVASPSSVTSSRRPASGSPGETIYETDTRRTFQWDSVINNWFKVSGPSTVVIENPLVSGGLVAPSNGAYSLAWASLPVTVPYSGILNIFISTAFNASANAAGYWRPVLGINGGSRFPIAGVEPRRFHNGGVVSVIPGGSLHIEVPVSAGSVDVGIDMTVDQAGAAALLYGPGSSVRAWI